MQSDKVASATLTFDDLIDESYLEVPAGVETGAPPARETGQPAPKVTAFRRKPESRRPAS